jgi:hypothetical protein
MRSSRGDIKIGKDEVAVEPLTPMSDELPFKVVRSNGTDEVLARAVNLLVARWRLPSGCHDVPRRT